MTLTAEPEIRNDDILLRQDLYSQRYNPAFALAPIFDFRRSQREEIESMELLISVFHSWNFVIKEMK